jgi:uncharacterized membrane protein
MALVWRVKRQWCCGRRPVGLRHAASLLTLMAFIFLAAAYVPRNGIKARFHHPMVLGVKFWALAHLLANGQLAQVLLFRIIPGLGGAGFHCQPAAVTVHCRARTMRLAACPQPRSPWQRAGLAWMVFALYLHGWLIGVRPFG